MLAESRSGASQPQRERWLVANGLGGGDARRLALQQAMHKGGKRLVPWAGCAVRLPGADAATACGATNGLAFCFLPLPLATGLPVHVNGYFELSSNRRDLWSHGDDLADGAGRLRADWNAALLRDGVAPLYADMLEAARGQLGPSSGFFALWPLAQVSTMPWAGLVAATLQLLAGRELVWVEGGGRSGRWARPRDLAWPDASSPPASCVVEALRDDGMAVPAALVPASVGAALQGAVEGLSRLTPAAARAHLAAPGDHPALALAHRGRVAESAGESEGASATPDPDAHLKVPPRRCPIPGNLSPVARALSHALAGLFSLSHGPLPPTFPGCRWLPRSCSTACPIWQSVHQRMQNRTSAAQRSPTCRCFHCR